MIHIDCGYSLVEDINFLMEADHINRVEFSKRTKVSRTTLDEIVKRGNARKDVYEKVYAYAYENNYRINSVKEELIKDVIVTDLGSKDDTEKILNKLSKDYNCIKLANWKDCKEVIDSINESN